MLDIHTHIGRWNNAIYTEINGTLPELCEMAALHRITEAVVMPSDQLQNLELLNQIKQLSDLKVYFFPWIDPKKSEIMPFLMENRDFISGLKFSASYERISGVTHELYRPFVDYALAEGIPILVHCGRWIEMAGFHYALELAREYPALRIICAHMGGIDPALQMAAQDQVLDRGLKNVWFDTSAVHDKASILRGIRLLGSDKFCFGSDYPLYSISEALDVIMGLEVTDAVKQQILSENAKAVIKKSNGLN